MDTRTIAIVGIDGSGKTTVIRRMLERLPSRWDVVGLINCPDYHEIPNAPLAQLSRDLDAFSQIADGLGDFQLKGVALYLQMTLYGPLSRFVVDTFHPRLLLSARHAVFDSLAYGSLYANIMKKPLDRARHEAALSERMEQYRAGSYDALLQWSAHIARRAGCDEEFWRLDRHVLEVFSNSGRELVTVLEREYQTTLPDAVIFMDTPAETAQARIEGRQEKTQELHERSDMLAMIRRNYLDALSLLHVAYPDIETHVVNTGDGGGIDHTVDEVIRRANIDVS